MLPRAQRESFDWRAGDASDEARARARGQRRPPAADAAAQVAPHVSRHATATGGRAGRRWRWRRWALAFRAAGRRPALTAEVQCWKRERRLGHRAGRREQPTGARRLLRHLPMPLHPRGQCASDYHLY